MSEAQQEILYSYNDTSYAVIHDLSAHAEVPCTPTLRINLSSVTKSATQGEYLTLSSYEPSFWESRCCQSSAPPPRARLSSSSFACYIAPIVSSTLSSRRSYDCAPSRTRRRRGQRRRRKRRKTRGAQARKAREREEEGRATEGVCRERRRSPASRTPMC